MSSATRSNNQQLADVAGDMFKRAAVAAPAVTWFGELGRSQGLIGNVEEADDPLLTVAVENIEVRLGEVGIIGTRFDKAATEFLGLIDTDDSTPFEQGLERLGGWLGFDARRPGDTGDPDGIWRLGDFVMVGLEAKSQQSDQGPISLDNARETQGHINWVRSNLNPTPETEVFGVIISPRMSVSSDALPQCESLFLVSRSEVRDMAREAIALIRGVRARATDESSDSLRTLIRTRLVESQLDPGSLLQTMKKCPLFELPVL